MREEASNEREIEEGEGYTAENSHCIVIRNNLRCKRCVLIMAVRNKRPDHTEQERN